MKMPVLGKRRYTSGPAAYAPQPAPSYTGPGDIVSFAFWGGFRAYSAATAGTKAIRVVRASDSAQTDINSLTNGALDEATLATFLTATSGKVVTIYDQVGTNHITQATDGFRPDITLNALGSSSGATFTSANSPRLDSATGVTSSQPFSLVALFKPTEAANGDVFGTSDGAYGGAFIQYRAAGDVRTYAGGIIDAAMSINNFHAFQVIFNGASSISNQDGSEATTNMGAQTLSGQLISAGNPTPDGFTSFVGMEFGYVAGTISGGNRTSLNSNMHAAYGSW